MTIKNSLMLTGFLILGGTAYAMTNPAFPVSFPLLNTRPEVLTPELVKTVESSQKSSDWENEVDTAFAAARAILIST